jgi:O-antigen ligase
VPRPAQFTFAASACARALELSLMLVVAASVAALGSVHPWAYVPLWWAAAGCAALLLATLVLRRRGAVTLARAPLALPALAMSAWISLQLAPLGAGGRPWTVSRADTARGLAFVAACLALHAGAAAVFEDARARARFLRFLAVLGFVLALEALVQVASGTRRIYGLVDPLESGNVFGPFVNRNHFAAYMLMLVPLCAAGVGERWRAWRPLAGTRPSLRRSMLALSAPEGTRLLWAALPALATATALVATTSRGALAAFVVALALAAVAARTRRGPPLWAAALAFALMGAGWVGLERLQARFGGALDDAPGRTLVWEDTLRRMEGRWLTGTGFNTFATAFSRVAPFALPEGATPWPEGLMADAARAEGRPGFRVVPGDTGRRWYRETHNDYVQLLAESGVPGLLLGLWAAGAALAGARRDPWLLAALAAVLLHAVVEFGFQIPAVAVLFVVLAGMAAPPQGRSSPWRP